MVVGKPRELTPKKNGIFFSLRRKHFPPTKHISHLSSVQADLSIHCSILTGACFVLIAVGTRGVVAVVVVTSLCSILTEERFALIAVGTMGVVAVVVSTCLLLGGGSIHVAALHENILITRVE